MKHSERLEGYCDISLIKRRLIQLFDGEISVAGMTISNEHLWELGYDGDEPNPHSDNIVMYMQYLNVLERLKEQAKTMDI